MANTSCNDLAEELLRLCVRGEKWPPEMLDALLARDCSRELLRVVVEGLADRFEPDLCDVYAALFSEVLAKYIPELNAAELVARYERIRRGRKFQGDGNRVKNIFVLSRVTLGADVAITSLILDAAKRRFPRGKIFLVGNTKSWELFAADPRIGHVPVSYRRDGSLAERLAAWPRLRRELSAPDSITIDPDSRLTQLGLLPVCAEQDTYFFETRSYGGDGGASLGMLTRNWIAETFGIDDAKAYIAPVSTREREEHRRVTISLGTGDNPAKRIGDPFEEKLLHGLISRGCIINIDCGAGGEEAQRVNRAIELCGAPPGRIRTWQGAFAPFAASIAASDLYVGYDSAGQHVAAACAVPLVSIFAGFATDRMYERWKPAGPAPIEVIRVAGQRPAQVIDETFEAVDRLIS